MSIKKSNYTSGNGRPQLPSPYVSNVPTEVLITHTFKEGVDPTDILELAYLPPYCRIMHCEVMGEGIDAATTLDMGFMTGEIGSIDANRTVGDELGSDLDQANGAMLFPIDLAKIESAEVARSIGVVAHAPIAAGSAKLHVKLRYATGS
ncbi:hypothetical protein BMI86_10275 [Thioclava sp. DLFJ5-1]|uniref:hypothetical protein n=1 Tax=Thioclava sp. DLFJ5-1 TaxID=1915314 RepID=UPI000998AFF5|nr:hypothetical protein [Thioclava sp. DLFJ5-1]OOY20883.1 hypothetical protein BMI86_10275 [Thioclava sp. DLFJ5-1]